MGKSLLPLIAGIGFAAATSGLGTGAVGAAGGAGASGAGATGGLGLAGDALAAQGAAGLLGSAGATAAGYGGAAIGAGGLPEIAATNAADIPPLTQEIDGVTSTAYQDLNGNQYWNQSITDNTGMTPNSYTGGFDAKNGIQRLGDRIDGFLSDGGMDSLGKLKGAFGGQQEQPQEPQNREITGQPVRLQPEQQGQVPYVYGQPGVQFTDEQKRRLYAMQQRGLL